MLNLVQFLSDRELYLLFCYQKIIIPQRKKDEKNKAF